MKRIYNFIRKNKSAIITITITITITILLLYIISHIYMKIREHRVVIFDLDETLGNFTELGAFCDVIEKHNNAYLTSAEFNTIMDLFPVFLRTDIIKILSYLKTQKQHGALDKVYIYTNNNGPKEWAERIKTYLEREINYRLFDRIIGAYKVNGRLMEAGRTSHDKTLDDFFNITRLPRHTKVCFLDDIYHEDMDAANVLYLHVKPYHASIPFHTMAERYYDHNRTVSKKFVKLSEDKTAFIRYVVANMSKYNIRNSHKVQNDQKDQKDQKDQTEESKKILEHLKEFLKTKPKSRTRKSKSLKNRISRKL